MFEGFIEERREARDGVHLFVRRSDNAGQGRPPLLLLHGYPQTSAMWRDVAPLLVDDFEVICPDLRGYGASDKPGTDQPGQDREHRLYSKREMGRDMVALMAGLGHERFFLAGHDRGGRVSHRLALDHPDQVEKLAVLDIAPTREMYARTNKVFAKAYWHWFFLIQPYPTPERMIEGNPDHYWLSKCIEMAGDDHPFAPEALEEYLAFHRDPAAIHALCEDYRAAYSIDCRHDDEDQGRKLSMPLRVLWGAKGIIDRSYGALEIWRERAEHVDGRGFDGTHYFAEEFPREVAADLSGFFLAST